VTSPATPSLVHQALLYVSAEQFLASAVPLVLAGLRERNAIVVVTTEEHTVQLRDQLGTDANHVSFHDAMSWFDAPGRTLAEYHRLLDEVSAHHGVLRLLGDAVWAGRDPLETAGWQRYESVLNVALATSPAWLVCGYDASALPADIVDSARRTHPQLAVGVAAWPSDTYADPEAYYAELNEPLPPPPATGVARLPFFADPSPVRLFVAEHALRFGVAVSRLDDLVVAVNEVVTNAIRHGAGYGEMRVWATERWAVCDIFDPGTANDRFLGFLRTLTPSDHGHGLWIARQLCDVVEIRTEQPGTVVRLHLRRMR
jgi:anti-sigma regulatory factor (Ser/Thr protein kinase)